jgi:hypothetical protein
MMMRAFKKCSNPEFTPMHKGGTPSWFLKLLRVTGPSRALFWVKKVYVGIRFQLYFTSFLIQLAPNKMIIFHYHHLIKWFFLLEFTSIRTNVWTSIANSATLHRLHHSDAVCLLKIGEEDCFLQVGFHFYLLFYRCIDWFMSLTTLFPTMLHL